MRLLKALSALGTFAGLAAGKVSIESISGTSAVITWDGNSKAEINLNRLDARSRGVIDVGQNGQYELVDLTPGAQYSVRVTEEGREPETLEFNTKPPKLTEIRASKFLNPTLADGDLPTYGCVLYWTPPEGNIDGYNIDVYPPHGNIKSPVLQKNGEVVEDQTQPRRVVTGLVPGEAYNFTISANSGRETGETQILETRIPPEIPGEIETVEVSSRTAILDWQREHRGYLDGFYLEMNPPDGVIEQPRSSTEKQREIVGLKPGKRYGVKVHSTAYGLLSFRPSERSIITLPEAPLGDLVVISQDPVNVTLSWTPPDGEAQMYQIMYYPTKQDARKLKELSINSTITLSNLDPGTEYNFEIETISNGVHSDPMVGQVITRPDEIENLKIVDKDFTAASFKWDHDETGEALFVVAYNPSSANSWPESPFLTRDPQAAVDGLMPGKTYTFTVKAIVDNVESKPKSVKVTLPLPEKPTSVQIGDITDSKFKIEWESPYDDALYVVNVMDSNGQLNDFPMTVDEKEVIVDNLKEGENYKITVATMVDGYTTDKHATQVETFADTTQTLLFPLDEGVTIEEAQDEFDEFAAFINEQHGDSVAVDIAITDIETIGDDKFGVVSVSIFAQPSVLSSASFNDLYTAFAPDKVDSNGEGVTNESFSEPINTDVNECKSKKNVCSINSQCIDEQILYRCACDDNYQDITRQVAEPGLMTIPGQVCVAAHDHCVRTNWRFQRAGYIVVRRKMPAVQEYSVCFGLTLDTRKMSGILTTYRQDGSVMSMQADQRGNLRIQINEELMFAPSETFVQGEEQKICLVVTEKLISFYVNGRSIASHSPSGSVALNGGGKIQIGRDPECSRRCEREIGQLDATVDDYTIWSKGLTGAEVNEFNAGKCINNAELTLEQDLVEPSGGKTKVSSDASDELYGGPMWADDLFGIEGRRFFSTASPHVTPDPTQSDFPSYQYTQADVQFMPFKPSGFESESTKTEMIIGNLDEDDLETFCKPDNMTVRVRKAFIDAYEEKYGALFLEDPGCKRFEYGEYYSWEIAPDLLGCGTSIELTDTHVTFVNSLSTLYSEENQIKPVNGIIFGNQLTEKQTTKVSMSVSCTFPLDYTVTADYPFLPQINMQVFTFNVSGHGEFSAIMQLYEDDSYQTPYNSTPEIKEEEMLNVGISLIESQDPKIRVTTVDCWATPEKDPHGDLQHFLIEDGCGVDGVLDGTLQIIENGQSKMAKWAGAVFQFVGYEEVWLHCDIRVCFNDADCIPTCQQGGRKKRDVSGQEIVTISTSSPVRRFESEENFIEAETHQHQGNKLIIGLIAGVCALTLLLLNAVGLIIFRRNNSKLADGMH